MSVLGDLPAGGFSAWLTAIGAALSGETDADVPCGTCTACCSSAQFVDIEPDEIDTLAHIPAALLFPAPRRPAGHVVLGHDAQGRCPMLGERGCTIYEHRPRTCRTFDCRVFAAAGVEPDDGTSPLAQHARRWRFDVDVDGDRQELELVRSAAAWFADGASPPPEVALRAVDVALSRRRGKGSRREPPPGAPSRR